MADGNPVQKYYPLKGNPELVVLCRTHRAAGMTFEHFRDVHAVGACNQLTQEDLLTLEAITRPRN